MFRRSTHPSTGSTTPASTIDLEAPPDPLRGEPDPDPVVEAAAERLREQLSSLTALDQWGRPVPWRQVARIALGPLATQRVRDAMTADALEEAVVVDVPHSVSPDDETREAEWRSFFRAIDETDRLLRDQP